MNIGWKMRWTQKLNFFEDREACSHSDGVQKFVPPSRDGSAEGICAWNEPGDSLLSSADPA